MAKSWIMLIPPASWVWRLSLLHVPADVSPCHCVQKYEIGLHEKIVTMINESAMAKVRPPSIQHARRMRGVGKILTIRRRREILVIAKKFR